jgi:O-antigen biosynthesis protein
LDAPETWIVGRAASGVISGSGLRTSLNNGSLLAPRTAEQVPAAPKQRPRGRPVTRGKFLFAGDEKLYLRGVTYGTFAPSRRGELFPEPGIVADDFAQMAANGFNAVRTYTVPPHWLLDAAADSGLLVMVGIPWEQHVDFLEDRRRVRSIEDRVRAGVASCAGHPAVLGYAVGNEIPSPIVRWLGRRPVERHIARLCRAAKNEDPGGLVTYVNYPPTEYLHLPFLDLMCFNVYLESRRALDSYLARLQNLAGDRPVVLSEVGLDSRRNGEIRQAEVLDWQVRSTFSAGCAGTFLFAWTDEWYVSYLSNTGATEDGIDMHDWDFGLTSRDRRPKPALEAVRAAFDETPFESGREWPRISVVVCTFNGERTLRACLRALRDVDYPNFEVIVVDDGSTDSTPAIAGEYEFRLISTDNRGLATARNIGLGAATGEIVAYLDDDAQPDPDWLSYLALAFAREAYAGFGGPNLPPAKPTTMASCMAQAPGGPTHVLISDSEAEHIPGCNMAFRKSALEEVGGFDPQFRVAGDDVDICWRLQEAGHKLGFCPAALVWHEPRGSLRAYWRQQRGYGRAEAMLERKWPEKYSDGGQARWAGRLYGRSHLAGLGRWRVYYGTWGSQLFQSLYAPSGGAFSSFLVAPQWYMWIAALAVASAAGVLWAPLLYAVPALVAAIAASVAVAGVSATRSSAAGPLELSGRARVVRWLLTTLLHLIQPLARMDGRVRGSPVPAPSRWRRFAVPVPRLCKTWTEESQLGSERLAEIESRVRATGAIVSRGGAYDRWDLQARTSFIAAARIRMGLEEHGAGRQLVRLHVAPSYSRSALALVVVLTVLSVAAWMNHAHPAALFLVAVALALGARAAQSAGTALGAVLRHVDGSVERGRAPQLDVRELNAKRT